MDKANKEFDDLIRPSGYIVLENPNYTPRHGRKVTVWQRTKDLFRYIFRTRL